MTRLIDLHTHTDQSDGSATPGELVKHAVDLGLEALAITDHDTLAGCDLAAPLARDAGLELVTGIELSTRLDNGLMDRLPGVPRPKRMPSVHVLGYFLDGPPSAAFREFLQRQQESRRKRNRALVAKLQSLGVDITLDEVQALGRNLTGRPHFAQVLLRKGYVKTLQEAFDVYLADSAKAAVEREEPTLEEGIRQIAAAGGIASLAHPVRLPFGRDAQALEALVRILIDAGMEAIEVYHSEHSPEDTELYRSMAARFGLIQTGGTDYHGTNKPEIKLGTGKNGNVTLTRELLDQMRARQVDA